VRERERAARESKRKIKNPGIPTISFQSKLYPQRQKRAGESGSKQERKKENERARERARYRVIPEHRNHRDGFDPSSVFLSTR